MRSIWTGAINFGLVSIPIKLYSAVRESHIHFNMLREKDLCPIGYKKICRNTGEEVSSDEIVRGYQYHKGEYVILDDEDFKAADVEKTYAITIEDFINEKEVDIKYAEKPYYIEPDKKSKSVYALFREALTEAKKVGIGKFVLKDREHLVLIKAQSNYLFLNMLRYHNEIINAQDLDFPEKAKIPRNQMDLALELIDKLSGPFHPQKYKDTYTDKLKAIIEDKKKGRKIPHKKVKLAKTAAPDIVSKLKESLALAGR
jgi:DNA end-binding protein Ku